MSHFAPGYATSFGHDRETTRNQWYSSPSHLYLELVLKLWSVMITGRNGISEGFWKTWESWQREILWDQEGNRFAFNLEKKGILQTSQRQWTKKHCILCEETFCKASDCKKVRNINERKRIVASKKLYFNCLYECHWVIECKRKGTCCNFNSKSLYATNKVNIDHLLVISSSSILTWKEFRWMITTKRWNYWYMLLLVHPNMLKSRPSQISEWEIEEN